MRTLILRMLMIIFISSLLIASAPLSKTVRLTVINKSGYDVSMTLKGKMSNNFYYLVIPAGNREVPVVIVFTVISDYYKRKTWQCGGLSNGGGLMLDGNLRLTFLPCGEFQSSHSVKRTIYHRCDITSRTRSIGKRGSGEPRMEKVDYFEYLLYGKPRWKSAKSYLGYWNVFCITWYFRTRTYAIPIACQFRYSY